MNYALDWTVAALNELAAVWNAATDRTAVTQAAHRLELALEQDPLAMGDRVIPPLTAPLLTSLSAWITRLSKTTRPFASSASG